MPKKTTKKVEKKAPKKAPAKKKAPRKPKYHLEIKVNDVEFKADAKTLELALTKFVESPEFPVGAKTTSFVKYSKGKNVRTQLWHTPEARRVFKMIAHKPSYLAVLAEKWTNNLA